MKKILFIILCLSITINSSFFHYETFAHTQESLSQTIDDDLSKFLNTVSENIDIPVMIWLSEIDTKTVETMAEKITGTSPNKTIDAKNLTLSKINTTSETKNVLNNDAEKQAIDTYIQAKRYCYSNLQSNINIGVANKIFDLGVNDVYVCKYSPCILAKITKNLIKQIANFPEITLIHRMPETEYKACLDISVPTIRANFAPSSVYYQYTGNGVKIGMIEPEVPDENMEYFDKNKIFYVSSDRQVTSYLSSTCPPVENVENRAHATRVAATMISNDNTYKGIAPEATLYCARVTSNETLVVGIERLISQGVSVINCSMLNDAEPYSIYNKWLNHLALIHSVHFVVSVGNMLNDDPTIKSFATAANVITVGYADDKNTTSYNDDEISPQSLYFDAGSRPLNKPDLVAPGCDIVIPSDWISSNGTLVLPSSDEDIRKRSGSSFSAPQVTATIALLIDAVPSLAYCQDAVKAILAAGINSTTMAYETSSLEFDACGAGMLDTQAALYTATTGRWINSVFQPNQTNYPERRYNFTVTSSDSKVRIALSWLKYETFGCQYSSSTTEIASDELANLALHVVDPNGAVIYSANSAYNNLEVIDFVPTSFGTYTIIVEVVSTFNWDTMKPEYGIDQKVYYAVAWW